jgi:hypothetical protein
MGPAFKLSIFSPVKKIDVFHWLNYSAQKIDAPITDVTTAWQLDFPVCTSPSPIVISEDAFGPIHFLLTDMAVISAALGSSAGLDLFA